MSDPRRSLPAVHQLVADAEQAGLRDLASRVELVAAVRATLAEARHRGGAVPEAGWIEAITARVTAAVQPSLRRVVNATGVVLHTNLGRAPLAVEARRAVEEALAYSTLEYGLTEGERGSRQDHLTPLLCELAGAEAALVVNNAAAALVLALNSTAEGGEAIVSRGELVEIGGAFRVPEIMAKSGAILVEVGTTNRSRLRDYALAVSPRTRLLLKVHRSNFHMSGFVAEATVPELVALGLERSIPVVHDAGSGLLVPLDSYNLSGEPLVTDSVAAGATVIFSGDKLLGGPQAGIIVGPSATVERMTQNPLARALRPDKSTVAALEATLRLYRDPGRALTAIPVLAMLTAEPRDLRRRARRLARKIPGARTVPGLSAVGGGAFPDSDLPTTLVAFDVAGSDAFLRSLREHDPPVVARATADRVVLDVRTIGDDEFSIVVEAVRAAGWRGFSAT